MLTICVEFLNEEETEWRSRNQIYLYKKKWDVYVATHKTDQNSTINFEQQWWCAFRAKLYSFESNLAWPIELSSFFSSPVRCSSVDILSSIWAYTEHCIDRGCCILKKKKIFKTIFHRICFLGFCWCNYQIDDRKSEIFVMNWTIIVCNDYYYNWIWIAEVESHIWLNYAKYGCLTSCGSKLTGIRNMREG